MTGGHIIVATLLGFVVALSTAETLNAVLGHGMAIIPLVGTIVIYFLEILVAFIQAYIFTFLTCLFLGQLVVHEHDEEHHEGDESHEHLPHATPGGVDQTQAVSPGASQAGGQH
jgi:F-type H+-transporting ATPase subunit a